MPFFRRRKKGAVEEDELPEEYEEEYEEEESESQEDTPDIPVGDISEIEKQVDYFMTRRSTLSILQKYEEKYGERIEPPEPVEGMWLEEPEEEPVVSEPEEDEWDFQEGEEAYEQEYYDEDYYGEAPEEAAPRRTRMPRKARAPSRKIPRERIPRYFAKFWRPPLYDIMVYKKGKKAVWYVLFIFDFLIILVFIIPRFLAFLFFFIKDRVSKRSAAAEGS